jgi:hypothetical protein
MLKLRRLVGFAVVLGAFLVIVAPALAEFQSLPTKSQLTSGKIIPIVSGVLVFHNAKGEVAGEISCPVSGISGTWKIRNTGKFLEEEKGPGQRATKRGPHLQIEVNPEKAANGCEASAGGLKGTVTIPPCTVQLHQLPGAFVAAGDVVTACKIEAKISVATCDIEIPAGNESTGENFQLTKTELTNKSNNQLEKINIARSITVKVSGSLCPLESNKTAQLEGSEFEAEGENAV